MYKKEVSLSKKVKELGLASGDMLELIEDKNNQLVEALLALNEVSVFILTLRFYFVVNIVNYSYLLPICCKEQLIRTFPKPSYLV